jgi:hypothetical protein
MKFAEGSNSQAGQESFVLNIHDWKQNGTYLEIGSGFPIQDSNTYILESQYNWRGVGIDLMGERVVQHNNQRKNPCLLTNAVYTNYDLVLDDYDMPKQIDYLQIDVDFNANFESNSLNTLKNILTCSRRFSVITFEHDLYVEYMHDSRYKTREVKEESRKLLEENGYKLVADNIQDYRGVPFEDWYIDPTVISFDELFSDVQGSSLFNK